VQQYAPVSFERGYGKLYVQHVLGPERGADLDFLVGHSGAFVARESH
jgi:dihydroxy-acid dehydratase